jgi:zinc-ribbon domain
MMMFGLGWLIMLLVIGIPVLLVILVVAGAAGLLQNRAQSMPAAQNQAPVYQSTGVTPPAANPAARYCSHCGAGLQSGWTHCPQCGAPIE